MSKSAVQLGSYAGALLLLSLSFAFATTLPQTLSRSPAEPKRSAPGYVGSERCQACHAKAYQTWHRSYHRSMTRSVRELKFDGVKSPQLPVDLEYYGRTISLFRSAKGRLIYRGPDLQDYGRKLAQLRYKLKGAENYQPETSNHEKKQALHLLTEVLSVERELVLATGSHHYLAFFVSGTGTEELRQLPFVYYLSNKKWVPRKDAFIQPPDSVPHIARWNANCIQCHSVAGAPRQTDKVGARGDVQSEYRTEVAELGIACEACHGPGEQHSSKYQSPVERLKQRWGKTSAAAIQNPKSLNADRSSQICGQCHSYFIPADEESFWSEGHRFGFLPGKELGQTRQLLRLQKEGFDENRIEAKQRQIFYANGAMRVAGREYNDLLVSPCFKNASDAKEAMGCLHCHNSHDSDPDDQLNPQLSKQQLCTQCHTSAQKGATFNRIHDLHDLNKPGEEVACVDCHMPKTSYALLKSIRSHRIIEKLELPAPQTDRTSESAAPAPPSCVLCHITEGKSFFSLQNSETEMPYSLEFILGGDAGVRAIMAEAFSKSKDHQFAQYVLDFLARHETYSAVKWIAQRAIARLAQEQEGLEASSPNVQHTALLSAMNRAWLQRDQRPLAISE